MSEPTLSDAVNSVAAFKTAVSACVSKASGARPSDFEDQVLTIVNEVIPHVKLAAAYITDTKTIDQLMEFAKRFVLSSKTLAEQPSGSNATAFAEAYDRMVKYLQAASSLNLIANLSGLSPRGVPASSPRSAALPAAPSPAPAPAPVAAPAGTSATPAPAAASTPVRRAGFAMTAEDATPSSSSAANKMSKAPSFATVRGKAVSPVAAPVTEEPAKVKVNKFQSTYTPAAAAASPTATIPDAKEETKAKVFRPIASAYGGVTSPLGAAGAADLCLECGKKTYPTDRLAADDKVFHKACFRCAHCNNVLKLGSYAALEGKYYCKPHFKQLFALKGNYAEGFGQEKHTAKWAGGAAAPATVFKGVDQAAYAPPPDAGADTKRRDEERRRQEEESRRKREEDERRRKEDAERTKRDEDDRRRREDDERRKRDEADARRRREEDDRRKREDEDRRKRDQDEQRRRREEDDRRKREEEERRRRDDEDRRRREDDDRRAREADERRKREEEADAQKLPKMNKVAVAYLAATTQAVATAAPPPASATTGPMPSTATSAAAATKKPAALRFQSAYQPAPVAEEPKKKATPLKIASTYSPAGVGAADLCLECGKKTYPTDRLAADDKVFHKACFRCAHCNNVLKLGSYAALEGKYYCKPHFKQLFALKGNYAEGFGQEKHTAKWQNPAGGAAPAAGGFKGVDQAAMSSPSRSAGITAGPGEVNDLDAIAREARDLENEELRLEEQAADLTAEEARLLEEERRLADEERRLRDEEERLQKSADISPDVIASAAVRPQNRKSKMISNKVEKGKARASVRGPMFTEKCGKCQLEISMMEENIFFKGTFYHVKCFTCVVCSKTFGPSEKYHPRDGQVYCEKDFLAMFFVSNMCAKCQKPLGEQFVDLGQKGQGQGWHPECFGCSSCNAKFPPGASCLNVRGKPYCEPCGRKAFTMRR